MRKGTAFVLLFLGGFLVVAGLVAQFWAEPKVKRTPIEVDNTTYLTGTADKLNPAEGEVESFDVKVRSVTESDVEASDDDTIIFVSSTCAVVDEGDVPDCVEGDDDRLVSASIDVFATDRVTAMAVDSPELPADAVPHDGLVNKFPFDAEKKTYPYWDGLLEEAVDAEYTETEEVEGMTTYVYEVSIVEEEIEIAEGVGGLYSAEKTIWVDPKTGSIVNQEQRDVRVLENGDPVLDLQVAFTDDQVESSVADAESSGRQLWLVGTVLPLVGIIGGLLLLGVGLFLVLQGRRTKAQDDKYDDKHDAEAGNPVFDRR